MPETEPLSRSSLEAYGAIVLGIVAVVFPMTWWLCFLLFLVIAGLASDVFWRAHWFASLSWVARATLIALAIMIVLAVGSWRSYALYSGSPSIAAHSSTSQRKPKTPKDVFLADFKNNLRQDTEVTITGVKTQKSFAIPVRLVYGFNEGSKFLAFFISRQDAYEKAVYVLSSVPDVIKLFKQGLTVSTSIPGDTRKIEQSDLKFSGAVYLYTEEDLSLQQQADIEQQATRENILLHIRGQAYYVLHWNDE